MSMSHRLPHRQAARGEIVFDLSDRVGAEVDHRCDDGRVGLPLGADVVDVHRLAGATGGEIAILDGSDLRVLAEVPAKKPGITAANMDEYARFVAVAYRDGQIKRWVTRKLIKGEKPAQDWSRPLEFNPSDYDRPEARLGMKLEKVDAGGFRVLGYLLGALRVREGPAPGDVITHVHVRDQWRPLRDLTQDLPRTLEIMAPVKVRFTLRGREKTEETEIALYGEPIALRSETEEIRDARPHYDLGLQFTWGGYIHRVDPEGAAAAAGIAAGDMIVELSGAGIMEAFDPVNQTIARGEPVSISIRSKGEDNSRYIEVTPKKLSKAYHLARLSLLYRSAGYTQKADQLEQQAIDTNPGDYHVYLALHQRERGVDENVKVLTEGVRNARHRMAMVASLARYYLSVHESDKALELVNQWQSADNPDHKLMLMRANILYLSEDINVQKALIPALTVAADQHNDSEAFFPLQMIYSKLGRRKDSDRYSHRRKQAEKFAKPERFPDHPSF